MWEMSQELSWIRERSLHHLQELQGLDGCRRSSECCLSVLCSSQETPEFHKRRRPSWRTDDDVCFSGGSHRPVNSSAHKGFVRPEQLFEGKVSSEGWEVMQVWLCVVVSTFCPFPVVSLGLWGHLPVVGWVPAGAVHLQLPQSRVRCTHHQQDDPWGGWGAKSYSETAVSPKKCQKK